MRILKILSNLRFAIFLILTIAGFSVVGSVIEQDQSLEFYQNNYPIQEIFFSSLNWKLIYFFQLNKVYKSFCFTLLLILFGTSLISCTFLQQFPLLKASRSCNFYQLVRNTDSQKYLNYKTIDNIIHKLNSQNYFVFQQENNFYGSKGLIGRISPIIVHISIVTILLSSIATSISGFTSQELIPKSEIFHTNSTLSTGMLSKLNQFPIRLNDFWITYHNDGKIKQFFSDISVLNNDGKEVIQKTISVNKPLSYKKITVYQTDWSLIGLRVKFFKKNQTFQLPTIANEKLANKSFFTWLPSKNYSRLIQIKDYKGNIEIYNKENLKTTDLNEFILFDECQFIDLITATGLQIKVDPSVFTIYFGFGLLIISTFSSYISFSQVWIINSKKFIFAKTNRAKIALNIELFKIF